MDFFSFSVYDQKFTALVGNQTTTTFRTIVLDIV